MHSDEISENCFQVSKSDFGAWFANVLNEGFMDIVFLYIARRSSVVAKPIRQSIIHFTPHSWS
jgi:hypothetical protein